MLTTRQRLVRTARIGVLIQAAAVLPALAAYIVAMTQSGSDSTFVQWCTANWWALLLLGCAVYIAVGYGLSFFQRCPHCRYRLTRAHMPSWALVHNHSHIRYCAHCGRALDETVIGR